MEVATREALLLVYDAVGRFCDGFAWARLGGKEFHIRRDGMPAYAQRYDGAYPFSGGHALVHLGRDFFKIDTSGERVVST